MSEERFERFVSRDFRGVSVIKSDTSGAPLLAGRGVRRQAQTSAEDDASHRGVSKGDLIQSVAAAAGLSREQARLAVDGVFDTISGALKNGQDVRLVGFGTFSLAKRKASIGRNPRTGEAIAVKASAKPSFKAGRSLKESVNNLG